MISTAELIVVLVFGVLFCYCFKVAICPELDESTLQRDLGRMGMIQSVIWGLVFFVAVHFAQKYW
jgi:hypothetical protein